MVRNIAPTAAAIVRVASQLTTFSHPADDELDHDVGPCGHQHHHGHVRHGDHAVDQGAPVERLDRVDLYEAQTDADHDRDGDDAVEVLGLHRRALQTVAPFEGTRHGIGGRAAQHRDRQ